MERKFIHAGELRIFYVEKNPDIHRTIFLFHGNSSSHNTWLFAFTDQRLASYRLIAFDLPAHGFSDDSSVVENGYDLPVLGKLFSGVIRLLSNGDPYLLAGVSLGTNIIAEMLAFDISPAGIVLAGPSVLNAEYIKSRMVIPDTNISIIFKDEPSEEEILQSELLFYNQTSPALRQKLLFDFKNVRDNFRSKLFQSFSGGRYSDEIGILRAQTIPLLIIFGGSDRVYYTNYLDDALLLLWKNKIYKLPGAGHWVHLDAPGEFVELLTMYAEDMFD